VGLWDIADPNRPTSTALLIGRGGPVTDVALRPDGTVLAIAGVGGTVTLWDLRDRHHPTQLGTVRGHVGAVNGVAFDPAGTRLVTSGDDGTVRLWDVADPARSPALGVFDGRRGPVVDATFSAHDDILSAGKDGVVLLWDTGGTPGAGAPAASRAAPGTTTARPIPVVTIGRPAASLVADASGRTVAVGAHQGPVRIASIDPGVLTEVACRDRHARIGPEEWNRLVSGLPYQDPCAGRPAG
jgi:WD40 repeat protein